MIKVVPPGSFDFHMPVASLMEVCSSGVDRGWMQKRAAFLSDAARSIRPERDHAYIHLISMGAMEAYGSNRNGDGFNEKSAMFELERPKSGVEKLIKLAGGLMDFHHTFTKRGNVYKHHQNTDPAKRIGSIYAEGYNPSMRRGELIIDVPLTEKAAEAMGCIHHPWADKVEKLASGKDIAFSMACKVAYDICSICGNHAKHRGEYCDDLLNNMSEITKRGNLVCAINDVPGFFDISDVFKPADRIAYSLRKVAAAAVLGGAALAEEMGVTCPDHSQDFSSMYAVAKMAAARKMAEIEKQIDAMATGRNNNHIKQLIPAIPSGNIPNDTMEVLKSVKLGTALQALQEADIVLAVSDFFKLVSGAKYASMAGEIPMVQGALPGLYNRLLQSGEIEECAGDSAYDLPHTAIPRRVKEAVLRIEKDQSQSGESAQYRAQRNVITGSVPQITASSEKRAAVSASSSLLAKEYAKYQLAFVREASGNLSSGLTVLQNYIN